MSGKPLITGVLAKHVFLEGDFAWREHLPEFCDNLAHGENLKPKGGHSKLKARAHGYCDRSARRPGPYSLAGARKICQDAPSCRCATRHGEFQGKKRFVFPSIERLLPEQPSYFWQRCWLMNRRFGPASYGTMMRCSPT